MANPKNGMNRKYIATLVCPAKHEYGILIIVEIELKVGTVFISAMQ